MDLDPIAINVIPDMSTITGLELVKGHRLLIQKNFRDPQRPCQSGNKLIHGDPLREDREAARPQREPEPAWDQAVPPMPYESTLTQTLSSPMRIQRCLSFLQTSSFI